MAETDRVIHWAGVSWGNGTEYAGRPETGFQRPVGILDFMISPMSCYAELSVDGMVCIGRIRLSAMV